MPSERGLTQGGNTTVMGYNYCDICCEATLSSYEMCLYCFTVTLSKGDLEKLSRSIQWAENKNKKEFNTHKINLQYLLSC